MLDTTKQAEDLLGVPGEEIIWLHTNQRRTKDLLGVAAEEILDNHARVRFTVIVDDKYHTTGLHHATVAKPTYAPDSSSPIEDRFIPEALKIPVISHLQTPTLERVLIWRN